MPPAGWPPRSPGPTRMDAEAMLLRMTLSVMAFAHHTDALLALLAERPAQITATDPVDRAAADRALAGLRAARAEVDDLLKRKPQ